MAAPASGYTAQHLSRLFRGNGDGATLQRVFNKFRAIQFFAAQRKKQRARLNLAAIATYLANIERGCP